MIQLSKQPQLQRIAATESAERFLERAKRQARLAEITAEQDRRAGLEWKDDLIAALTEERLAEAIVRGSDVLAIREQDAAALAQIDLLKQQLASFAAESAAIDQEYGAAMNGLRTDFPNISGPLNDWESRREAFLRSCESKLNQSVGLKALLSTQISEMVMARNKLRKPEQQLMQRSSCKAVDKDASDPVEAVPYQDEPER